MSDTLSLELADHVIHLLSKNLRFPTMAPNVSYISSFREATSRIESRFPAVDPIGHGGPGAGILDTSMLYF